jgi:hypothetical protein
MPGEKCTDSLANTKPAGARLAGDEGLEPCIDCEHAIAGKPAPTGFVLAEEFAHDTCPCRSRLAGDGGLTGSTKPEPDHNACQERIAASADTPRSHICHVRNQTIACQSLSAG